MSSSTRWTSRALVAGGVGSLLVLGATFGVAGAASADDAPPGTLPPEPTTTAPSEHPARDGSDRPGTLPSAPPAEAVPAEPNFAG
jgi:hypothetical protein